MAFGGIVMNIEHLQGNWQQLQGEIRHKWSKLTNDDLRACHGDADILIAKLTERYGTSKKKATKKLGKFLKKLEGTDFEIRSLNEHVADILQRLNNNAEVVTTHSQQWVKANPLSSLGFAVAIGILLDRWVFRSSK